MQEHALPLRVLLCVWGEPEIWDMFSSLSVSCQSFEVLESPTWSSSSFVCKASGRFYNHLSGTRCSHKLWYVLKILWCSLWQRWVVYLYNEEDFSFLETFQDKWLERSIFFLSEDPYTSLKSSWTARKCLQSPPLPIARNCTLSYNIMGR